MAQTVIQQFRAGSPVVLGTMTFGSPTDADAAALIIDHALARGVRMIDTANMYEGYARAPGSAGGVAEAIIGEAVRGRRDDVLLATKLGMKVGDGDEDEGTSAAAIRKHLPLSLERLQTDWLDVYYLHRPDDPELLPDTLMELRRAMREGAIRSYGVSNYDASQLAELIQVARAVGAPPPMFCQPPLSLLKPGAADALLPFCHEEGIVSLAYQVLQGGLLTGKYNRGESSPEGSRHAEKPGWLPELDGALFDRLEALSGLAISKGMTLYEYAVRWALTQPSVGGVVIGARDIPQLDAALAAAE